MALTWLDIAKNTKSNLKAGIVKGIIETTQWLNLIPMKDNKGNNRYEFIKEDALPDTGSRQLGTPYATETHAEFGTGTVHLKTIGGEFSLDRQLADQKDVTGQDQIASRMSRRIRAFQMDLKRFMVNGNKPTEPEGIKKLVTSGQTIGIDGSTAKNMSTAGALVMVRKLDELIDKTEGAGLPTFLLTNRDILRQMNALALTSATNNAFAAKFLYEYVTMPGINGPMTVKMATWDGVPIFSAGFDSQRVNIMAFDETALGSDSTSSIYAIVAGDDLFSAVIKDMNQPKIIVTPGNPGAIYTLEGMFGTTLEHESALAKLEGILVS